MLVVPCSTSYLEYSKPFLVSLGVEKGEGETVASLEERLQDVRPHLRLDLTESPVVGKKLQRLVQSLGTGELSYCQCS